MKWLIKSLIGLFSFITFILIYSYMFKGGSILWLYADLVSILGLVVLTAVINRINYTIKEEWGFIQLAFLEDYSTTPVNELQEGILFFRHLEKILYCVAAFMSLWAIVSMMANLEDTSSVGPNMAVSILVIIYSVFINILLIHPCQIKLKKQFIISNGLLRS